MFLAPGKPEWVNISLFSYVQSNLLGFRYFGNKIQKGFSSFQQVLLNLVCTKLFSHQTNSVFFENINFLSHLDLTLLKYIESSAWVFSSLDSTTGLLSNILQMKRIVNNKEHNEPILQRILLISSRPQNWALLDHFDLPQFSFWFKFEFRTHFSSTHLFEFRPLPLNSQRHFKAIKLSPFRVYSNSLKGSLLKSVVERSRW